MSFKLSHHGGNYRPDWQASLRLVKDQARRREAALSSRDGCGKVKWIPDRKV